MTKQNNKKKSSRRSSKSPAILGGRKKSNDDDVPEQNPKKLLSSSSSSNKNNNDDDDHDNKDDDDDDGSSTDRGPHHQDNDITLKKKKMTSKKKKKQKSGRPSMATTTTTSDADDDDDEFLEVDHTRTTKMSQQQQQQQQQQRKKHHHHHRHHQSPLTSSLLLEKVSYDETNDDKGNDNMNDKGRSNKTKLVTTRGEKKQSLLTGEGEGRGGRSINNNNNNNNNKKSAKRLRKEAEEDREEKQLTALLFGTTYDDNNDDDDNDTTPTGTIVKKKKDKVTTSKSNKNRNNKAVVWKDDEYDDDDDEQQHEKDDNDDDDNDDEFAFEIDRKGIDGGEVEAFDVTKGKGDRVEHHTVKKQDVKTNDTKNNNNDNDEDEDSSDDDDNNEKDDTPAWVDPDDDTEAIKLVDASNRLKKLRRSRQETEALSTEELERRLRQRYEQSTQITARTDWAKTTTTTSMSTTTAKNQKRRKLGPVHDDDDDDEYDDDDELLASRLFSTSQSLLATGSTRRLPPNILGVTRCPDVNLSDPNKAVCRAVHFHPGSDPDQPLILTAGLDKTLRFFQVGEETSEKIHGIHFPKLPIYNASFLGSTGRVVVSGRRSFFYFYDAVSGKVDLVPRILGREERSWEKHCVSPDGRLVAFVGNDGYIVLVDAHSKHGVGTVRLNGSVRAVTFTHDGQQLLASGSDGDVYRWDVHTRSCIERFSNGDGTITSSMAATSTHLAVGAESGVVNLYSERQSFLRNSGITQEQQQQQYYTKTPLRSIMNLHTSADMVKFNSDGQILALSSQRESHGLKLLHVPSRTVFSNWPTSKTPLRYVWCMDFAPQSQYLALGNDKGQCLLYKLTHYNTKNNVSSADY